MDAGRLRERLTFQAPVSTSDGYGGEEEGFEDRFTVWARVRPLKGGERVLASRLTGTQPYVISVRRSSETRVIASDWRAVDARDASRVFQIKSPPTNTDEVGDMLEMLAETGVAG